MLPFLCPHPRAMLFVLVAATAFAQATTAPPVTNPVAPELAKSIVHEGIDHSQVMVFQDTLCQEIGARLTGSLAFQRACEWTRDAFAAMGLQAQLEQWAEWQSGWDREQWMGRITAPVELELQVASPAWTGATRGIARGTLVRMPATTDDQAAVQQRLDHGESLWLWGVKPKDAAVRTAVDQWLAAGKLLGLAQSAASTGWNDKNFPNQIRVFGDHRAALRPFAERPRWGHAVVRDDQAAAIDKLLDGTEPVVAEFELRNRWRQGPVPVHNVIAELRGTEFPGEVVVVCAHLDSWHQAAGATDNGTGTCSTLEAARILTATGARPRRTIRFILWGGEEQGLLGSRQYVVMHRREMPRIAAVFNHDGGTNWASGLTVPASQADDFAGIVQPILELLQVPQQGHDGPVFKLNPVPVLQPAGGGSDHASFGAVGVPAFGWHQAGEVQYGRGWHSQWDTWSIVVARYQAQTATVIALVVLGVANLDHLLSRQGVERARPGGPVNAQLVAETWLGVEFDKLEVKAVGAGGPAQRAGIQVGDLVAKVGDHEVGDAAALVAELRAGWEADAAVQLTLQRAGGTVPVTVTR